MGVIQPIIICAAPNVDVEKQDFDTAWGAVRKYLDLDGNALPVVVASEFLFAQHNPGKKFTSLPRLDGRWEVFKFLRSIPGLVVLGTIVGVEHDKNVNFSPIYFKGAQIKKVYKGTAGGAAEYDWHKPAGGFGGQHQDTFTITYGKSSETFCGVEICNDIGSMKAALKPSRIGSWPELYMMPSYGMAMNDIFQLGNTRKTTGYVVRGEKGKIFKTKKYTVDLSGKNPSMMGHFALNPFRPGVAIQADGHRCRVAYKWGLQPKFTMVLPLGSAPLAEAGFDTDKTVYLASIHVFPSVDLNPLKAFWA
jgi:hypothetical protein